MACYNEESNKKNMGLSLQERSKLKKHVIRISISKADILN